MRKILSLTLAASLLLCGCSAKETGKPAEPEPTAQQAETGISEETSESGKVIITRIGVFSGDGGEIVQEDSTHSAEMPDQNAVLCTGGEMTLSRVNVKKSGDAFDEKSAQSSGMNAAVAAAGGGIHLIDAVVTSNAAAADALSAIGDGSKIEAANTYVVTAGAHSAGAVALDRGEIALDGCSVASDGENAPCAVVSGSFEAKNAKLRAAKSNSLIVKGGSVSMANCEVIGASGVLLDGGDTASAAITLENCLFVASDETPLVMQGGSLSLTLKKQQLNGLLSVGSGELKLSLAEGSSFTGTITADEPRKISISLDADSTWNVTAETEIGAIADGNEQLLNIQSNGFTVYYDSSLAENAWLDGASVALYGGGYLVPRI